MKIQKHFRVNVCLFVCLLFFMSGCSLFKSTNKDHVSRPLASVNEVKCKASYVMNETEMRAKAPKSYFAEELNFIKERRAAHGLPLIARPAWAADAQGEAGLLGLALSGGGIRSNAFQLGLLSGLHERGILAKVDYISAVSGGSWASAAYKLSPLDDDALFEKLNDAVVRENLEINSERMKPLFSSYGDTIKRAIKAKLDFFHLNPGTSSQQEWRRMLLHEVLSDEDIPLMHINADTKKDTNRSRRPYIIFNATHSSVMDQGIGNPDRFPFEMTSHFIGARADCGNREPGNPCKVQDVVDNTEYISMFEEKDIEGYKRSFGFFIPTGCRELSPLYVSHAMAIAGAVVPSQYLNIELNMLRWNLELPPICCKQTDSGGQDTGRTERYTRVEMKVSDGGQSENLGALALIERGVPLIVISDAGLVTHKGKYADDLDVLRQHAESLFKVRFNLPNDPNAEFRTHEKIEFTYAKQDGKPLGKIIYIKPLYYTEDFKDYLFENAGIIRTYLDTIIKDSTGVKFPEDRTLAEKYDTALIQAYYLMGRFFAVKRLDELK